MLYDYSINPGREIRANRSDITLGNKFLKKLFGASDFYLILGIFYPLNKNITFISFKQF